MSELYGKYFKAILIKNASMINYKHSETNEKKKSQHRNRGHKGIPNGNFIAENYNTQN